MSLFFMQSLPRNYAAAPFFIYIYLSFASSTNRFQIVKFSDMSQFVRPVYYSIVDFFVQKTEDTRYCRDQLLKDTPYLLCDGELDCLPGNIPEEPSDSLVVAEPFRDGKDVVLDAAQYRGGNLGCEAGTLAFAESEIGLAVLEHDFNSPPSGVYLPCLEESKLRVGGEKAVPFAMPGTSHEENPYGHTSKRGVKHDIIAFEPAAVLLQLESLSEFDKGGGREVSMSGMVSYPAVLADFYHARPVAFHMTAMDEPYNVLVGKPTVRQHIAELYATADGPPYHLPGKLDFGHVVFLLAFAKHLAVVFGRTAPFEFPGAHAIVPCPAFFSDNRKVKKNLGDSVCHGHAEAFESEHRLVGQMGMDPAYFLDSPACLLMVGVIKNQADISAIMAGTPVHEVPQLYRHVPEGLPPVYRRIFHEAVEDILSCLDQRLECAIPLIAAGVFDTETREKNKALKHRQQTVHTITLACDGKRVALGHSDLGEKRAYGMHGGCHIRIFEKVFDIRKKRCNFAYRHGYGYFCLAP